MRLYELTPQRRPVVVHQMDEPLGNDINKVFAFLKAKKLSELSPADLDLTKQAHELWFAGPAYLLDLHDLQRIRNSEA